MALIKCEECGSEVSDKAVACPKCGAPIAELSDEPILVDTVGRQRWEHNIKEGDKGILALIAAIAIVAMSVWIGLKLTGEEWIAILFGLGGLIGCLFNKYMRTMIFGMAGLGIAIGLFVFL